MGMIRGTINVVEAEAEVASEEASDPGDAGETPGSNDAENAPGSDNTGEAPDSDGAENAPGDQAVTDLEPIAAEYTIPTDEVAVATLLKEDAVEFQSAEITLTDEGFSPAVVVLQSGIDTEWMINVDASIGDPGTLLVPAFTTQVPLSTGENPLYVTPTTSFDFSTSDNVFYGYVKIVEDINNIDIEAIKVEVKAYKTLIYPQEYYSGGGDSSASCH
jgi:hypothetical protein